VRPLDTDLRWRPNSPRGVDQERPWTALWRARELVGYFAQPVASVAIFTLVFSHLAGVSSEGVPYPLFALVGMVTWTYFASAVLAGSSSLVLNASLVTKVYFPRMAAPAASLLPPAVDLAVSLVLVGAVAAYYRVFPGLHLLAAPLWLLLLLITAFGVSLWVSALNVRYRDVQHAVAPILQVWFFASPVAYSATQLEGWQEYVYALNPVVGVIELGRWSLLDTPWPGRSLLVSAASAAVLLIGGLAYFSQAQRSFADVI
jgi:ABC-type polysaccharide/polyol phosphate export permease